MTRNIPALRPVLHSIDARELSAAERAQQSQEIAKVAAQEHSLELGEALIQAKALAQQIRDGGDIYPPGLREICRRLSDSLDIDLQRVDGVKWK